jgi:hypothetical protein
MTDKRKRLSLTQKLPRGRFAQRLSYSLEKPFHRRRRR